MRKAACKGRLSGHSFVLCALFDILKSRAAICCQGNRGQRGVRRVTGALCHNFVSCPAASTIHPTQTREASKLYRSRALYGLFKAPLPASGFVSFTRALCSFRSFRRPVPMRSPPPRTSECVKIAADGVPHKSDARLTAGSAWFDTL